MSITPSKSNALSLLPLVCFLVTFLCMGLFFSLSGNDFGFYHLSPAYATIPAIVVAAIQSRLGFYHFFKIFLQGMLHKNIVIMCGIFLLAGAFSAVAKSTGGVEAIVNLGLNYIPPWFLLPGIFIIAAFISTAMGTSVGTIAAIAPIALGIADTAHIDSLLIAGTIISGAMFGDNLSIISDTTIASTRSQGCRPADKFRENLVIAAPAAFITIMLFFLLSTHSSPPPALNVDSIKVLPYLLILSLAIAGVNVFAVLICGLISAGIIGLFTLDTYNLPLLLGNMQNGCWNMKDIIILSMLIGGLGAVMEKRGGLIYVKEKLDTLFSGIIKGENQKAKALKGELAIASLVSVCNLATANNTIAIILSGRTAKIISESYAINPKRTASLLDIFSCVVQGLIPWGAQLLLLAASFSLSPVSIMLYSFYPVILALVTLAFISVNYLLKKH